MRRLLCILILLSLASSAWAQTATPTITQTPTPLPTPARPYGASLAPLDKVMLNKVSVPASSGAIATGFWPAKSLQVTVEPVCTSYSLTVEGINGGTVWAAIGSAITQADVGAGASKLYDLSTPMRYTQVRLTAITDCTVSVYLHGEASR